MRWIGFNVAWRIGMVLATCAGAGSRTATAQALPPMPATERLQAAQSQAVARTPATARTQSAARATLQAEIPIKAPIHAADPMQAQVQVQIQTECGAEGYRVMARRWDALLQRSLEVRQDCAHPERPARMIAVGPKDMRMADMGPMAHVGIAPVRTNEVAQSAAPLLVHAGDRVRLWSQDERVRIEMSGVVEQSARSGDRVLVQVTRRNEDTGMSVERIAGIVRAVGDVEMEP